MSDKLPGIHADHGAVSVGQNYGPIAVTNHFVTQSGLSEEAIRKLEMQYLQRLVADCGGLEWLSLMNLEEGEGSMCLDAVYTELLTESREKQELPESREDVNEEDPVRQGRLSAVELLNREQRLVLLGDPGSGKSAFVNFVALCLAGEQLGDSVNLTTLTQPLPDEDGQPQTRKVDTSRVEVRQDWSQGIFIPLRIILRDFSASASFPNDHDMPETHHLLEFLQSDLKRKGCEAYFKVLEEHLRNGQVLVMLDGLDEVPQAGDRRKHLVACIDGFVKSFGTCRYLVTCRPYAYRDREWQLPGFASGKLAAFERGQIIRFIERWYDRLPALDRETTVERGKELQRKVLGRPDSRDLARRPLLLSLIAYLHAYHHEWPERRADLYESLLELLVNKWEKARFNVVDGDAGKARQLAQASLAEYLQIGQDGVRNVLERLAFRAHVRQDGQEDTADIAADELNRELTREAGRNNTDVNISKLSEHLRDRVGILYQRGGSNEQDAIYTFPHRSFQEYLSAAYLRREEKALFELFPKQSADLVDDTWQELIAQLARSDPDRWREVVILSGGIHALSDPGPVWVLLKALTDREDTEALTGFDAWGLRLAGEILAESVALSDLNPKRQKIFNRIQHILPEALTTPHLAVRERLDIGRFLGRIGDPRAALTDVDAMPFCHVPAGPFFMGKGAYDDENEAVFMKETPSGEYDLNYDYWIAQYPVTVAQFRMFADDSGFKLGDTAALKADSNSPVVRVSQQEALAFCDWLTLRWQQADELPEKWKVTLPNEPEWEKAVRGGLDIPVTPLVNSIATNAFEKPVARYAMQSNPESQRRYPWGNLIDDSYANYQMNAGGISTPGIYAGNTSPYGCHDLAGNVWEWTRSGEGDYPYPAVNTAAWQQREKKDLSVCVLRGGAFGGLDYFVRCAVRHGDGPDDRSGDVGFRVVLSPCR